MRKEYIEEAEAEAKRFLKRVQAYRDADPRYNWQSPCESGALRRASMDLTRALTKMRRIP